jgi:Resolvase, N terminal domain
MNSTTVLSKSGLTALDDVRSEKLRPFHRERLAVVYVRQSTPQQVLDHQESTRLQYGLVSRAQALGWEASRILVIDDDQGKSGTSAQGRVGFQRLVSEVSLDHVGIIFGVEMSRLARSNKDWHQLLELCALFHTLIADLDGMYDPALYNDRLLLGLYVIYNLERSGRLVNNFHYVYSELVSDVLFRRSRAGLYIMKGTMSEQTCRS